MSQRVGKLQQENAKLREEIKRLKGALKDINHDITQEPTVMKPKKESSLSKERKKIIREEIDNRCNYIIPSAAMLKKKNSEVPEPGKIIEPETLVASFGQEEDKNFLENSGKAFTNFINEADSGDVSGYSSKDDVKDLSIEAESAIENSPEFDQIVSGVNFPGSIVPKVLKESFSSYYNDESVNKTINEKSLEEFSDRIIPYKEKKDLIKIDKNSSDLVITEKPYQNVPSSLNEKTLISEIEALRKENLKLRLQISGSNKKLTRKARSKSKSKSPIRKAKSRSMTPRDLSSRPVKRNVSNRSLISELNLTPRRSRHCNTCDHLLSKGYSTKYCSKHGNAKLNPK
jgi:cell division septum initiation protein DivIVA